MNALQVDPRSAPEVPCAFAVYDALLAWKDAALQVQATIPEFFKAYADTLVDKYEETVMKHATTILIGRHRIFDPAQKAKIILEWNAGYNTAPRPRLIKKDGSFLTPAEEYAQGGCVVREIKVFLALVFRLLAPIFYTFSGKWVGQSSWTLALFGVSNYPLYTPKTVGQR